MKRPLLLLLLVAPVLALAGAGQLQFGDEPPRELDAVYQVGEVIYLPAEPLLGALGVKTNWNTTAGRLTITYENNVAAVTLFSETALVNGRLVPLGATPRFIGGRLCLPVSFFEQALPKLLAKSVKLTGLAPHAPAQIAVQPYVEPPPGPEPPPTRRRHMLSLHRIVLDAGHGGHDSGARSPQGLEEKDVNLALVLKLARRLRRGTDLELVLTRRDDIFIPLAERTRIANEAGADLFMCLHANGAFSQTATGFEVYFLSAQASDARAAALARAENSAEAIGSPIDGLPAGGDDLSAIFHDLIRTENLAASERLAVAIQSRLDLAMDIENRGVKQAPFYVLVGAQMPAVLVEVGFMSNPIEAAMLFRPETQDKVVSALYESILYYDQVRAASE